MRSPFALFQSHLDLAQAYWKALVKKGDTVIDATCGNGHDTLKLSQLALSSDKGKVYAFDIQPQAIQSTLHLLKTHLSQEELNRVSLMEHCHSTFPEEICPESVKLCVYNLGYLPGGDKTQTTKTHSTLASLQKMEPLLQRGGAISMTCYPGHAEGEAELQILLQYVQQLSPKEWSCCHHTWENRHKSPTLLLIQKSLSVP